jgi:hypothetical protein
LVGDNQGKITDVSHEFNKSSDSSNLNVRKGTNMKHRLVALILFSLCAVSILSAQVLIVAQAPDGAGWRFTLVLTNTTGTAGAVSISFYQDTDTSGDTAPWTPPFLEAVNLAAVTVPAGSSVFLHSMGTAATLTQGWAQITGTPGIQAYVIYTYTKGLSSSDATAPGMAAASRFLVPFDNTGTLATEIALVNPNPAAALSVTVNLRTSSGITQATLTIPPNGQIAVVMSTQFAATAGQDGLAEFYANSGNMVIIALRSNTNRATGVFSFTSAPVFSESGPPIISTSGGGGGGGGIPAGDITVAGFTIGRTKAISGSSVISTIENVGGEFQAFSPAAFNPIYQAQRIGSCAVYTVSYSISGKYPLLPDILLDAGSKLTLTGPSLPAADQTLPRSNTPYGPQYVEQLPVGTLVDGGTYTLAGTGGTQVEGFNTSTTVPKNFTTNLETIASVDRSQNLILTWTGTGFDNVVVQVTGMTISGTTATQTVVSCLAPASPGTFSVPSQALGHLPSIPTAASGTGTLLVYTAQKGVGPEPSISDIATNLTPNLVQGGKIQYGIFAAIDSEEKPLPII